MEGYSSFLPRSNTKIRTIKACCIPEKIPIFEFWNGCYKQDQDSSVATSKNYITDLALCFWFYWEISREICIQQKHYVTATSCYNNKHKTEVKVQERKKTSTLNNWIKLSKTVFYRRTKKFLVFRQPDLSEILSPKIRVERSCLKIAKWATLIMQ